MPSPDTTDNHLANNPPELTDAETEALKPDAPAAGDAGKGSETPPAEPKGEAGKEGSGTGQEPAAGAEGAGTGNTGEDQAAKGEATPPADNSTPAGAEPPQGAQKETAPNVFVPTYAADERDYEAELKQIKADLKEARSQHGNGDLDDDAYEARYEELQDKKDALLRAQTQAQMRAEISQQNADQAWAYLQNQFFSDPANAAIRANGILFAAWEAGMQEVVNDAAKEGRAITDWEIMVGARKKLVEQGVLPGGAAVQPPPKTETPAPPKPDRTPPLKDVPQGLATAPSAAEPGTRSSSDALAETSDIEEIEAALAGKSEAERDALLRGTPGAFLG